MPDNRNSGGRGGGTGGKRNATAYCEAIVPATGKVACTAIGTYAIIPKK